MLRKMIRDGYKRRIETKKEFSYVYFNGVVLRICKSGSIADFIRKQQVHIARYPNNTTIKRVFFADVDLPVSVTFELSDIHRNKLFGK